MLWITSYPEDSFKLLEKITGIVSNNNVPSDIVTGNSVMEVKQSLVDVKSEIANELAKLESSVAQQIGDVKAEIRNNQFSSPTITTGGFSGMGLGKMLGVALLVGAGAGAGWGIYQYFVGGVDILALGQAILAGLSGTSQQIVLLGENQKEILKALHGTATLIVSLQAYLKANSLSSDKADDFLKQITESASDPMLPKDLVAGGSIDKFL